MLGFGGNEIEIWVNQASGLECGMSKYYGPFDFGGLGMGGRAECVAVYGRGSSLRLYKFYFFK